MKKRMILGSGKLYLIPYVEEIPDEDEICIEKNLFCYISGGATLAYTPESYVAKDDLGYVSKTVLTNEEATLSTGIATINGGILEKLVDTARVTENVEKKRRTVKIGGIGNSKNAKYILCFHHEDKADGDIWVTIVGQNQAGLEFSFVKDQETIIDSEFTCLVQDGEGTLIKYTEEDTTITGEEIQADNALVGKAKVSVAKVGVQGTAK